VYLDILEEYCRDAEDRSGKMVDALQKGDMQLFVTLTHALKGSSRSVGAMDLGDTAAWLEKSAKDESPERIRETTAELAANLRTVIGNIRGILAQRKTGDGQGSSDISGLRLDELKAALVSMNMEAVIRLLLEYTSLSLDTETRSKIAKIEDDILLFEYEKAVEKINTLFM
jgi:HPt (histidine-containing phosphotransfer) domain-containing protein